jgi:hypothetical protein
MQLFIQGQWWSNLSTQILQILQCLLLGVLITSHSGHKQFGSNDSNNCIKSYWGSFYKKPGFNCQASTENIILVRNVIMTILLTVWLSTCANITQYTKKNENSMIK